MFKKILLAIFCFCCLLLAVGCGNSEPVPGDENTISVEVVNKTEDIIISWAAFFGPGLDEWGEDLLGDRIIGPGETIVFVLPEGEYNLALFTYELYVVESIRNINEDTRIEVGGEGLLPILVENNTEKDIALFFISPSDAGEWGEDRLGDFDVIIAEAGRRYFFVEPGVYDFMAADIDGDIVFLVQEMDVDTRKRFIID